ncbi:MAG: amidase [Parasphingorhabdus sp.]|jgi:amidase
MTEPCDLDALDARRLMGNKQLSPVELMQSCLNRIDKVNPKVNAVVAIDADAAMEQARQDEQAVMQGMDLGLLHGLPIGVKDLECVAGMRTTFGSLLFEDNVPEQDDNSIANVRANGANIFCKTNTPEFGAGGNTRNRVYGATGNPFNVEKTCAGSSGGSAVALATGMMPIATGSDYGGSLRTPSSFCGVVGFRSSPGIVPKIGSDVSLSPFGVLGPMARNVRDAHLLLQAQAEVNKHDPFSNGDTDQIPEALHGMDLGSLRVGFSADLGCAPVDNNIRSIFEQRINNFRHVFAECEQRDPYMENIHETFEILRCVSWMAGHTDQLMNQRDLLCPNVIDNTSRGNNYSLQDVFRANQSQSAIYREFIDLFEEIDILICPSAAVSPFPHAQWSVTEVNGEPMTTYMTWLTLSYALTTALASVCTIPCGVDHLGMPFGIQVAGPNGSDALVLEVAYSLEQYLSSMDDTKRPLPNLTSLT